MNPDGGFQILVMKEDLETCNRIRSRLGNEFDVIEVDSFNQGINRLKTDDFDVVISDVVFDGKNIIDSLEEDHFSDGITSLIFFDDLDDSEYLQKALNFGPEGYIFEDEGGYLECWQGEFSHL